MITFGPAPTLEVRMYGETYKLMPELNAYGNNRLAIDFVDADTRELFGHLTVNLPDQHLNVGEVFAKHWSENEPLFEACVSAGWLTDTGREVVSGFVSPKVMRLSGMLLSYIKAENRVIDLVMARDMVPGRTYRGTADCPTDMQDVHFTVLGMVSFNPEDPTSVPDDRRDPGTLIQVAYDAWAYPLPMSCVFAPGDIVVPIGD